MKRRSIPLFTLIVCLILSCVPMVQAEGALLMDHAMSPDWTADGWRVSGKIGTVTQMDGYVNVAKDGSNAVGGTGVYNYICSPVSMTLPTDGFTLISQVRIAGEEENGADEISVRLGDAKVCATALVTYGSQGRVFTPDEKYSVCIDTTVWHDYRMIVYPAGTGYAYDLYIDDKLAWENAALYGTTGGTLIKLGQGNDYCGNMDIRRISLYSGAVYPEGAEQGRLTGIVLSGDRHTAGTKTDILAQVTARDFPQGTKVVFTLTQTDGTPVEGAVIESELINDTATAFLTFPADMACGIYSITATAGRQTVSTGYTITRDLSKNTDPGFPAFKTQGLVKELADYKYNPSNEFNFPCIVDTTLHGLENTPARYYLYYAPHEAPGGLCLMYSDSLDGPWTEYALNPLISNKDPNGGYSVNHVSTPNVVWNSQEACYFMYFHGDNGVTRYSTSDDLIHWTYGGVCVTSAQLGAGVTEASYANVTEYEIPGLGNRYTMLLMGNQSGVRKIFCCYSDDGRRWNVRPGAMITPTATHKNNLAGPKFIRYRGRYFVICNASDGNMYLFETDETLTDIREWGIFYDSENGAPDDARAAAPSFIQDGDTVYMFYEAGVRLKQTIAYATAVLPNPAKEVDALIEKLPDPAEIVLDDRAAVSAARAAYDKLDDADKPSVTLYGKLVAAEAVIAELEKPVEPIVIPGDMDNNGAVNVADILALKNLIMAGEVSWTEDVMRRGDMDNNGKLNVADILAVKNIIMQG